MGPPTLIELDSCTMKSDSSLQQKWRVTPLYINCEEWLLSTMNVKCDSSTAKVKSDINCEEWLLSTTKVKSLLLSKSIVKSDSSLHQLKSDSTLDQWLLSIQKV